MRNFRYKYINCSISRFILSLNLTIVAMAYIYETKYALNKSASKNLSVAVDIVSKKPKVLLSKTIDKIMLHLTFEEYFKVIEGFKPMTLLLRQDLASSEPTYVTDDIRIGVTDVLETKAVLIERLDSKNEVVGSIYYCLSTLNVFESLQYCIQHVINQYANFAHQFEKMTNVIVQYIREKRPLVNFETLHLSGFQRNVLQVNPVDLPLEDFGGFDKVRCFYEFAVYHPYLLSLSFNNAIMD